MYLSQLTLNPRSVQARRELARPYEMHRTLARAFPQETYHKERDAGDAAGVLFRAEQDARSNQIRVLVQATVEPNWTFLQDIRDARGQPYLVRAAETKMFELNLTVGQALAFRLRANPTKRLGKHARDENGKRVGIYDEQEQLEWLRRKAEAGGFEIVRAEISRDGKIENAEAIVRAGVKHDLKLLAAQFDGVLRVTDTTRVVETVARGIGSGKAFGFGLLSLARA